jgi:hypothetical protein
MASTYVNDLRLNEMATGDQSGSWGTVTNTNLELIAEAFSYGTEAITTNADTHTTTIADGATDPGRSMFLKYTGTLDSACTITIGPNTVSKLWFIENATSGSQNIIIKQGSGATVTIASGKTKVIYSDGVGSGAKMVDAFDSLSVGALASAGAVSGTTGTFSGAVSGTTGTFSSAVSGTTGTFSGAITSGGNITVGGTNNLIVNDSGAAIFGNDGDLSIGNSGVNGIISAPNGDLTLDSAGEIILDADGADIIFKDGGLHFASIRRNGEDAVFKSIIQDKDIIFKGNDGGVEREVLRLDMSDAGQALFNKGASFQDHVYLQDNDELRLGNSDDLRIYHDGSNSYVQDSGTGELRIDTNGTDVRITKTDSEYMGKFIADGGVELYHNNSKKFETTSSGITVTGQINSGDCRGEVEKIGRDTSDFISVESTMIDFALDGATDMRLYNSGDLHVEGNVIAYSTTISDERLKKDIVKIDNALDKVSQLNGYTFEYLADGKKSAGVIAQEVEKVMPSAITESTLPLKMGEDDKTEYKTVQYDQLHGLMIEAIKELKAEIEELKAR